MAELIRTLSFPSRRSGTPLTAAAARYPGDTDARDILDRIQRLRDVAGPDRIVRFDALRSWPPGG
ncbi:hypothetical protein [Amycolatopsis vastitatis]|uniref:hypothetical protein n=1 Tax=Amycolatopsis vastitatis TaxID=1905142 RepID=UPI0011779293|nr:hypothetical protein [Amycolatopsis vastitatis]